MYYICDNTRLYTNIEMQNVFQLHKLLQYWFKGIFWLYVNTINKLFKKSCKMNMALTSFKKQ